MFYKTNSNLADLRLAFDGGDQTACRIRLGCGLRIYTNACLAGVNFSIICVVVSAIGGQFDVGGNVSILRCFNGQV